MSKIARQRGQSLNGGRGRVAFFRTASSVLAMKSCSSPDGLTNYFWETFYETTHDSFLSILCHGSGPARAVIRMP